MFLSIVVFTLSSYFVFDIVMLGFDWLLFLCSIVGFISVHYLWPAKHDDESAWYDLLEYVIDFPFRLITLFIRSLGDIFRNADSGLDL